MDINVSVKTVKLLGGNIGINLFKFMLGSDFLDMIPKAQAIKLKSR